MMVARGSSAGLRASTGPPQRRFLGPAGSLAAGGYLAWRPGASVLPELSVLRPRSRRRPSRPNQSPPRLGGQVAVARCSAVLDDNLHRLHIVCGVDERRERPKFAIRGGEEPQTWSITRTGGSDGAWESPKERKSGDFLSTSSIFSTFLEAASAPSRGARAGPT